MYLVLPVRLTNTLFQPSAWKFLLWGKVGLVAEMAVGSTPSAVTHMWQIEESFIVSKIKGGKNSGMGLCGYPL